MKAFYENRSYNSEIPVSASLNQNLDFVAHWHKDIEMIYVCDGQIGMGINSDYKVLQKGEAAICGSNDIHYYDSKDMSSMVIMIIFRPEVLEQFKHIYESPQPISAFFDRTFCCEKEDADRIQTAIKSVFYSIVDEMRQKEELYSPFTLLRILELFLTLFRHFPDYHSESLTRYKAPGISFDITPMQKALKFIEENYTQEITLEQAASEAELSRFYFSRLFHKTTGMNFNAYLTRIRTDKAEMLLKGTSLPIINIAYESGFNSIRTFNRSFKAIKGCTPKSLRRTPVNCPL